jgi:cytosine permease
MAEPESAEIVKKPWDKGIAPSFIGLFLWVAYYDQLARLTLPVGGLFWPALGAAVAGLLCCLFLYYAPAMWGLRSRRGFIEVSEATFGKAGSRWLVGLAIAAAQVGWFAVATYYATDFALRGLVAIGLLDAGHIASSSVGGLSVRGPLFLGTAFVWGLAFAMSGYYALRPISAIMAIFPVFPALTLALATGWAFSGLADFRPSAMGATVGEPARTDSVFAFGLMIQLIFGFFATAATTAAEWGAGSRDARDVRLGGIVGVMCGATILAILSLLIVAGAVGRQIARDAEIQARRGQGAMIGPANPRMAREIIVELRVASADEITVGGVLQRGIGGVRGGAMLFVLCLGSMAPAVYASSAFGARLFHVFPVMPRRRWTSVGTLMAFPLVVIGAPAHPEVFFGVLGALLAPLIGAITADFVRHWGAWPGSRGGVRVSAVVAWVVGMGAGLIPVAGRGLGSKTMATAEPAAVGAFVISFVCALVLGIAIPGTRRRAGDSPVSHSAALAAMDSGVVPEG